MRHYSPQYDTVTVYKPWRLIQLSDAYDIATLVDEEDWLWLREFRWNFLWHKHPDEPVYARRNIGTARETVYLHREVMRRADPRSLMYECSHVVDHINGNTLDNRRANLRWATKKLNAKNRHIRALIPTLETIMTALGPFDLEGALIPF